MWLCSVSYLLVCPETQFVKYLDLIEFHRLGQRNRQRQRGSDNTKQLRNKTTQKIRKEKKRKRARHDQAGPGGCLRIESNALAHAHTPILARSLSLCCISSCCRSLCCCSLCLSVSVSCLAVVSFCFFLSSSSSSFVVCVCVFLLVVSWFQCWSSVRYSCQTITTCWSR